MDPDIQIAEQTDLDLAGKPEHVGICLLLFLFIGVIEGQKLYVCLLYTSRAHETL